jgi:hypothetical protein
MGMLMLILSAFHNKDATLHYNPPPPSPQTPHPLSYQYITYTIYGSHINQPYKLRHEPDSRDCTISKPYVVSFCGMLKPDY